MSQLLGDEASRLRELERRYRDGARLTEVNRALVGARDFSQVTGLLCRAARELCHADGATFILREGDRVRYVDEDARAPLWKGKDFPIGQCISGWAMLNAKVAAISDIYLDERVPHDAYRPTFVKSLVMTPVGPMAPIASLGVYWAQVRASSAYELELLQSLASAADLALAAVRAWEQAVRADRLKDQFLATVSHELRNPLNSIAGYADLLQHNEDAMQLPLVKKAAATIHRNAMAQAQLIDDLLDLARLQTGKLALQLQLSSLSRIVTEALESARSLAAERRIELQLELPKDTLYVNVDPVRVQQVVWNLVHNAVKFTRGGGRVKIVLRRQGELAELTVDDNGQGIEPSFLPHVFDLFRQEDGRATRAHGGLGVGLALVHQLVELHHGEVEAFSDGPNTGSRFVVRLPLERLATAPEKPARSSTGRHLDGAQILVLDDTLDALEMLSLFFEAEGAHVVTASNGKAGLAAAAHRKFDLIVSDIGMPEMDGYTFLQQVRTDPRHSTTPAIAITGFGREQDVLRARQAGFALHVTKPFDFNRLVRAAKRLIAETL